MRVHGQFTMHVEGRIIHLKVVDNLNAEGAQALCGMIKETVGNEMDISQPWAVLLDTREWGLNVPEAGPIISELKRWSFDHNQTHQAMIVDGIKVKEFQLESILKNSSREIIHRYFADEDSALDWLRQAGFTD